MLGIFTLVAVLICAQASPTNEANELIYDQAGRFNTEERIARDGYYSEAHDVITSDGYILEIQRIPFRRYETIENADKTSKPAIYLMHGLQGSSLSYITLGPDRSLAYLLAEEGYDVWMGNARGGLNSRRHIRFDPDVDAKEFFDYSFEDIGMKDLPAVIDYILDVTGRSDLHYVGHSQGGTAFLVLNSMIPEYNKKIKSAHLLAGVGYMDNFPNKILSLISLTTNAIYTYALRNGVLEIPDFTGTEERDCEENNKEACSLLDLEEILGDLFGKAEILAGASIKQYAHFGQNIRSKTFRRWNYNSVKNMLVYGSTRPPQYDISAVTVDVTMHYTVSDDLLDEKDVIEMAKVMPNAKIRKIERETYSHTDFIIAPDSKELLYDYMIEELNKHQD